MTNKTKPQTMIEVLIAGLERAANNTKNPADVRAAAKRDADGYRAAIAKAQGGR